MSPLPSSEYFSERIKGIRQMTLKRLVLLWMVYCQSHEGEVLIDLRHQVQNHNGRTMDSLRDVAKFFMAQEQMSRQTAYDYAKAVQAIQENVTAQHFSWT